MKKIIAVLVLAAVAAGAWYAFTPSRESLVKKAFAQAAASLEKAGTETSFEALAKARKLSALAEPQCVFEIDGKKFQLSQERSDVTSRIVSVRNMAMRIHVVFENISVSFPASDTAEAVCGFFYDGDNFGLSVRDANYIEATLRRDGDSGKWRFSHVRATTIVEK